MESESLELKKHISQLSDEELLEMVTTNSGEYREEALKFAKAEIDARGIDFVPQPVIDEAGSEEAVTPILDTHGTACLACGGRLRFGTLVAEKELTVIFTDNREERFVRVRVCSECGQVLFAVDYETEVRE